MQFGSVTSFPEILEKVDIGVAVGGKSGAGRINALTTAGNNKLCEIAKDPAFLIAGVIKGEINRERASSELPGGQQLLPRFAHVILSSKDLARWNCCGLFTVQAFTLLEYSLLKKTVCNTSRWIRIFLEEKLYP